MSCLSWSQLDLFGGGQYWHRRSFCSCMAGKQPGSEPALICVRVRGCAPGARLCACALDPAERAFRFTDYGSQLGSGIL